MAIKFLECGTLGELHGFEWHADILLSIATRQISLSHLIDRAGLIAVDELTSTVHLLVSGIVFDLDVTNGGLFVCPTTSGSPWQLDLIRRTFLIIFLSVICPLAFVARSEALPTLSHYDCHEVALGHVNDLVVLAWENVCDVHKGLG